MADDYYDRISRKVMAEVAAAIRDFRQLPSARTRQRARYPVGAGGGKDVLMKYVIPNGTDNKYLGPMDQNGVQVSGKAELVDGVISGVGANDGTQYDVDATYFRAVVAPDDYFWARKGNAKYWAVAGGVTYIDGLIDSDGRLAAEAGSSTIAVDIISRCGDEFIEGQSIAVIFRYVAIDGGSFRVVDVCCPPT
jgi:hypothetical protein